MGCCIYKGNAELLDYNNMSGGLLIVIKLVSHKVKQGCPTFGTGLYYLSNLISPCHCNSLFCIRIIIKPWS